MVPHPLSGGGAKGALAQFLGPSAPDIVARFVSVWLSKCPDHGLPSLKDLDPVEMPWALPHIFLLHRNDAGRFAYQLVGEVMAGRLGGSLKGKTADQVFEPDYAIQTEKRWEMSAEHRRVFFNQSYHHTASMWPVCATRVSMPLSTDGETVDRIVGVAHFMDLTTLDDIDPGLNIQRWTTADHLRA